MARSRWFRGSVPVTALAALGLALAAGCGDNGDADAGDGGIDAPAGDLLAQLAALPGAIVSEWAPPTNFPVEPGYRYFDLRFTLPVDHDRPAAGSFQIRAALMHKDVAAPLVVYTGGYDLGWARFLTEPAQLVEGNQLSLEYRFYASSRPAGPIPWGQLRVGQAAADEHDILELIRRIYTGKRIATGGSKGGENALLRHHLYPGDYDGVVAYVAPVITAFPDTRYDGILDRIGVPACRDRLRALGRRMLERRVAMQSAALLDATYAAAGVAHAVETGIVELEFSFWMTRGEADCGQLPDPATASDAALYEFLDETSAPAAYGDADLAEYGTQYIYQDHVELGYPTWMHAHLDDLLVYSYEDWSVYLPPGEAHPYDPAAPIALAAWLGSAAEHVMLINGEWDPWAAGTPSVGSGRDAFSYTVPRGSHWSSGIYSLTPADQTAAIAQLRGWAGLDGRRLPRPVAAPRAPMATGGPDDPRLAPRTP